MTGDQILPMSKRRLQILNALKSLQNKKKLPTSSGIPLFEQTEGGGGESPSPSRN